MTSPMLRSLLVVVGVLLVGACGGRRHKNPEAGERPHTKRDLRRAERKVARSVDRDELAKKNMTAKLVAGLIETRLPPKREAALVRRVLKDKQFALLVRRHLSPETLARLRTTYDIKGAVPDPNRADATPEPTPEPTAAVPAPTTAAGAAVKVSLQIPEAELAALGIKKIAVPTIVGTGVDETMIQVLSDVALSEAGHLGGLSVIGAADIEAMLNFEQQKDLLGCTDDVACMAQIGGALGVDALLACKIGRLGNTYVITTTVIDIRSSRPLARGDVRYEAEPDELIDIVAELVRQSLMPVATAE